MIKADPMLSAGQLIQSRYLILNKIAEGGQSLVYLARDQAVFGRLVVVKAFKVHAVPVQDLPAALKQFTDAACLLAPLDHPGIARIGDWFVVANVPFIVTDYVAGSTLEDQLRSHPASVPETQVVQWADQLCDVLTYLHTQQPPIIFRDLKPDNIMLSPTGQIKLIDFGIARTFKQGQLFDTEAFGAVGYAAPEQYGKGQTGPWSDVYALGVTLLRLATGFDPSVNPFQLPRADTLKPAISAVFTQAIERATQLKSQARFASAEDFRRALHAPQPAPMLPALKIQPPARVQPARFPRWLAGMGLVLLLAVCGGLALFTRSSAGVPAAIAATVSVPVPALVTFESMDTTTTPVPELTRIFTLLTDTPKTDFTLPPTSIPLVPTNTPIPAINTSTITPIPPTDTPIPATNTPQSEDFIRSLNPSNIQVRFFETGGSAVSELSRIYTNRFDRSTTRMVAMEVNFQNLNLSYDVELPIRARLFAPGKSGSVTEINYLWNIGANNQTESRVIGSWGWDKPGMWLTGVWTVVLYLGNIEFETNNFRVFDTTIIQNTPTPQAISRKASMEITNFRTVESVKGSLAFAFDYLLNWDDEGDAYISWWFTKVPPYSIEYPHANCEDRIGAGKDRGVTPGPPTGSYMNCMDWGLVLQPKQNYEGNTKAIHLTEQSAGTAIVQVWASEWDRIAQPTTKVVLSVSIHSRSDYKLLETRDFYFDYVKNDWSMLY